MAIVFYVLVGCPKDEDEISTMDGWRGNVCKNKGTIATWAALALAGMAAVKMFMKKMENSEKRARITNELLEAKKKHRAEARKAKEKAIASRSKKNR